MFQLLLESNAAHTPRVGGSVFSTMGHVALVAAAIALTAAPRRHAAPINDTRVTFVPVPTPVIAPRPRDAVTTSPNVAPGAMGTPSLPTIVDIPIGLPPIELNVPVGRAFDFGAGPRGRPDGTGELGSNDRGTVSMPFTADQVDKPVLLRPGAPAPSYPEMLRSAGIAGIVVVEFVVDTLGTVETGSMKLLQTDHDLFAAAVARVVPTLRFLPAEAMGRKVRQLVRLPFRFDLRP